MTRDVKEGWGGWLIGGVLEPHINTAGVPKDVFLQIADISKFKILCLVVQHKIRNKVIYQTQTETNTNYVCLRIFARQPGWHIRTDIYQIF